MEEYYILLVYAQRAIKYSCLTWAVYLILKEALN